MKCPRRDEQHVIRLDGPVLGIHRATFHQRQQVALHALARHVGAGRFLAPRDLVDFVDEHDAVLLGVVHCARLEFVFIDHFRRFLIDQELQCFLDLELALAAAAAAQVLKHPLQLLRHFLHARGRHDFHAHRCRAHLDFDLAIVEFALAQHLAETLSRLVVARRRLAGKAGLGARQERVQDPVLGGIGGAMPDLSHLILTGHFYGDLDKIPDDRIYFATNIANFGEFRGLHLDEGRLRQTRQPARDLRLADAGGTDHEDVLRRNFGAQRLGHVLTSPAIAQGNRHGALRGLLADNVLVELLDDLSGRHLRHLP